MVMKYPDSLNIHTAGLVSADAMYGGWQIVQPFQHPSGWTRVESNLIGSHYHYQRHNNQMSLTVKAAGMLTHTNR